MQIKLNKFLSMQTKGLICLIFYGLALYISILPATDWFKSIPGDLGDARFNSYILEHVYQWTKGDVQSLWSPQFFFPFEGGLAFSDNHFGSIFTYLISRNIGLDRENAYIAWFTIGSTLNYFSMYYVLRKLGFSNLASAFGAIIYAVSLPTAFKTAHAQLVYRFAIPLALLCFWNFFVNGRAQYFFWMVCFVAWQFFCSVYLGVFSFYLLLVFFIGWLVSGQNKKIWIKTICKNFRENKSNFKYLTPIFTLTLCVGLMLMLRKYLEISRYYGFTRNVSEIDSMLPRLESYAYAPLSLLYGSFVDMTKPPFPSHLHHEHMMFIGVFSGVLLFIGIVQVVSNKVSLIGRISLFSLTFLFCATLYIGGGSIYHYALNIPGISAIRAVSRIVLVMLIPASILIAIAIDGLKDKFLLIFGRHGAWIVASLLSILGGAEIALYNHYNTPKGVWRERHNAAQALLGEKPFINSVIYIMPDNVKDRFLTEIDAMIIAQNNGLKTFNGYSGNTPLKGWGDGQSLYACLGIQPRITSYIEYAKTKGEVLDIEALQKDLRSIVTSKCSGQEDGVGILDTIPHELASKLKIAVDIKPDDTAVIELKNNSNFILTPEFHSGPIRFSWRIIPDDGKEHNNIGWDSRLDLNSSVNPGKSISVKINPSWPKRSGKYKLEVSIVYEGVAWFHNLGLQVGQKYFTIK